MDLEITKVTKEDLAESNRRDDYIYSADWKRLISFPPIPEEGKFNTGSFHISSSTKIICDNACDINHCGWLSKDVDIDIRIPEGVTHLGDYVFKGRNLYIVEIPRSLTYIGKNPFALTSLWKIINHNQRYELRDDSYIDTEHGRLIHNISDHGKIVIEDDIKIIGEYSFSRNEKLNIYSCRTEDEDDLVITIPSTVREIGDYAFENSRVSVVIFLGLPHKIGKEIFKGCTLLKAIHVPVGLEEPYKHVLHENANLIDCTGNVVSGIVFRNLLASNGITSFYKVSYDWEISIYAFIKDYKFHFSDEQGNELKREDIGIPFGVIVFDLVDEQYKWLKEESSCKGKGIAIDNNNHFSWIDPNEDFYVRLSANQIVIHKCELINDLVERAHIGRDYHHRARLFGENSELAVTSIDEKLYYYTDSGKIRIICDGKLHPDQFDSLEIKSFENISCWKHFIIVSKIDKWGFFTIDGKYIEPHYYMVECLRDSYFYVVQKLDGCQGIINIYGEEILEASNMILDVYVVHCQNINLIATTEDNIYILCCGYSPLGKRSFSYRCSSLDINKSDVLKIEIANAYKYDHERELITQFIYVIKKDGREVVFDDYGQDVTDSNFYYEWEEHEWDARDTLYDIMPEKKKKTDNTFATKEKSNDDALLLNKDISLSHGGNEGTI